MNLRRTLVALVAALSVALSAAGGVLAATSGSDTTETATVDANLTVTGIAASIDWTSAGNGGTIHAGENSVVVVSTGTSSTSTPLSVNSDSTYKVQIKLNKLTSGANQIPVNVNSFMIDMTANSFGGSTPTDLTSAIPLYITSGTYVGWTGADGAFVDVLTCGPVCSGTAGAETYTQKLKLTIPTGTPAGTYAGALTTTVSTP
jgi:hypothetical protein